MRTYILFFILTAFLLKYSNAQPVYSTITYDAGTSIEVQTGADVCATTININGTYSGGGSICTGALPVMLSSFTGTTDKRNVTLMWVTDWELNNSGFDIERANLTKSGIEGWSKIAFVEGNGTSNVSNGYLFKDEKLKAGTYKYRLKQIDFNGNFEYFSLEADVIVSPPSVFSLSQNYPNPSNPRSKIEFEIPLTGRVTLKVYDILGKEVYNIIDETKEAGYYSAQFDGSNLASGVYFYRIVAESETQKFSKTLKMILVK
ncbi:MAG: T9SS type A sorting domain-containing protein [Ignavibacteria bacterium]|nr:T9SS type A sorting domain-containing protein [Ignavibacteria bacterium]